MKLQTLLFGLIIGIVLLCGCIENGKTEITTTTIESGTTNILPGYEGPYKDAVDLLKMNPHMASELCYSKYLTGVDGYSKQGMNFKRQIECSADLMCQSRKMGIINQYVTAWYPLRKYKNESTRELYKNALKKASEVCLDIDGGFEACDSGSEIKVYDKYLKFNLTERDVCYMLASENLLLKDSTKAKEYCEEIEDGATKSICLVMLNYTSN